MKNFKFTLILLSFTNQSWCKPIVMDFTSLASTTNISLTQPKTSTSPNIEKTDNSLRGIIISSAKKNNLRPELVKAIISIESNFNTTALSPRGAVGLMQVLPSTASMYGSYNLYNPNDNITVGSKHLAYLIKKYQYLPYALAAYNAGEGNVDKYNGIPPFAETQNYVLKVLKFYNRELDLAIQVKQPIKETISTDTKVIIDQLPKAILKTKSMAEPKVILINL